MKTQLLEYLNNFSLPAIGALSGALLAAFAGFLVLAFYILAKNNED